jgi:hypothetical protein
LLVRSELLRRSPAFIRSRTDYFHLAPSPFASSPDGDLYLPEELFASATDKLKDQFFPAVTRNTQAGIDPNPEMLQEEDLGKVNLSMVSPKPIKARSMLGLAVGDEGGRKVIFAHPISELYFVPPEGSTHIDAEVGILDGAFAPTNDAPTDGVSIEIFELQPQGLRRILFRSDLDPAHVPNDRGLQYIHLDTGKPLTGFIVFRLTPGPHDNMNSDWAYWGQIKIH